MMTARDASNESEYGVNGKEHWQRVDEINLMGNSFRVFLQVQDQTRMPRVRRKGTFETECQSLKYKSTLSADSRNRYVRNDI